jgi:hypothetical protein
VVVSSATDASGTAVGEGAAGDGDREGGRAGRGGAGGGFVCTAEGEAPAARPRDERRESTTEDATIARTTTTARTIQRASMARAAYEMAGEPPTLTT